MHELDAFVGCAPLLPLLFLVEVMMVFGRVSTKYFILSDHMVMVQKKKRHKASAGPNGRQMGEQPDNDAITMTMAKG